jgi:hypothetical protein
MQFVVNPAELPVALKVIRGETEARQHNHEDEAIPDLQPPLDGFECFHYSPFIGCEPFRRNLSNPTLSGD